jgi:hypothetical protein
LTAGQKLRKQVILRLTLKANKKNKNENKRNLKIAKFEDNMSIANKKQAKRKMKTNSNKFILSKQLAK